MTIPEFFKDYAEWTIIPFTGLVGWLFKDRKAIKDAITATELDVVKIKAFQEALAPRLDSFDRKLDNITTILMEDGK